MKLKKWFKSRPAWVRGGIIGAIIAIIGILASHAIGPLIGDLPNLLRSVFIIIIIPFQAISLIFTLSGIFGCWFKTDPCYAEMLTGHIVTTSMFFGIGAYLTWMKSKKKLGYGILSLILFVVLCIAIFSIAIH